MAIRAVVARTVLPLLWRPGDLGKRRRVDPPAEPGTVAADIKRDANGLNLGERMKVPDGTDFIETMPPDLPP
jgi:hypothetical protein